MSNVMYKKVVLPSGRNKYVPVGVYERELPTGIYFVDVRKNTKSTSSCSYLGELYKIGDPKVIDLTEICGMQQLAEKVMETKEFRELISNRCSISEIVAKVIAIINSFNKQ